MANTTFLIFYAIYGVILMIGCLTVQAKIKKRAPQSPMAIPVQPDPYKIAYLRSGAKGTMELAVFELAESGYLQIEKKKSGGNYAVTITELGYKTKKIDEKDSSFSFFLKSKIMNSFNKIGERYIVTLHLYKHEFNDLFQSINNELVRDGAIFREELLRKMQVLALAACVLMVAMGAFKITTLTQEAIEQEINHTEFIWYIMFTGTFIIHNMCWPDKLTQQGRDYLKQLKITFKTVKYTQDNGIQYTKYPSLKDTNTRMAMLTIAVFGFSALCRSSIWASHYENYKHCFFDSEAG